LSIQPTATNVLFCFLRLVSAARCTVSACLGSRSVALEEQLTPSYQKAIKGSALKKFLCFPKFCCEQKTSFQRYNGKNSFNTTVYFALPNAQTRNLKTWLRASVATLVVSKRVLVIVPTQFQAGAFALGK